MLFHLVRLSEFLPNNQEIENIFKDLFNNYMNSIQHSVYNELLKHIKMFDKSSSRSKSGKSNRSRPFFFGKFLFFRLARWIAEDRDWAKEEKEIF
jgi:hypothetical protein